MTDKKDDKTIVEIPDDEVLTDMSESEKESLAKFKTRGHPGIHKINDAVVYKMFNLYLAGRTYSEISQVTKEKKDLVLYLSSRFDWFKIKMEYLLSLNNNLVAKVSKTRLESINFLTNLMTLNHKYYSKQIDKYLMSGDDKVFESLNLKPLEKYMKAIDVLEKLMPTGKNDRDPGEKPFAEIHLSGNAEISSNGPGQLKVIQEDPEKQLVSALANFKREMEKSKEENGES